MAGITTVLTLGLVGCSSQNDDVPSPPNDPNCDDWEWDSPHHITIRNYIDKDADKIAEIDFMSMLVLSFQR